MRPRTNLDWVNEINRIQGRGEVAAKLEKERELQERIDELELENKKLKNDLDNKNRDLGHSNRKLQSLQKERLNK